MLIYGPVPSRRLGQSLGINNIPPKTCSYSCVYCQIGRTNHMSVRRCEFYKSEEIYEQTKQKLREIKNERVDYLSFVPDGEPTLDIHLGHHIDLLKPLGIKIAVITNASLLWMDDVQEDLMKADLVSVKIDAVNDDIWKKIDRPSGAFALDMILRGTFDFAKRFKGTLITETMLVSGYNDGCSHIRKIAEHISGINPQKAYILVPIRPPAETNVFKPDVPLIKNAFNLFKKNGIETECIIGDESDDFYFSDDIERDLLSIAAVHPVREEVLLNLLSERNLDEQVIDQLIDKKLLSSFVYEGKKFFKNNL